MELDDRPAPPARWRGLVPTVLAGVVALAAAQWLGPHTADAGPDPPADGPVTIPEPSATGPPATTDPPGAEPAAATTTAADQAPPPAAGGPLHPCAGAPVPGRPLDLNTATVEQLIQLPGIGPTKAARVVAWRRRHGRFRRVVDLRRVSGFGYKTVRRLAPYLVVTAATTVR